MSDEEEFKQEIEVVIDTHKAPIKTSVTFLDDGHVKISKSVPINPGSYFTIPNSPTPTEQYMFNALSEIKEAIQEKDSPVVYNVWNIKHVDNIAPPQGDRPQTNIDKKKKESWFKSKLPDLNVELMAHIYLVVIAVVVGVIALLIIKYLALPLLF